jgi:hypothetical protein
MEYTARLQNTFNTSQNGEVASGRVEKETQTAAFNGFSGEREIDDCWFVFCVAPLAGSGFAYPRPRRRRISIQKNGARCAEDIGKTSFNTASVAAQN